ncbi:MAG: DoxX family protein [Acidobacteria bacterium]|nr:DoxX family protein [Acidobacteriota bacterium]
MVAPGLLIVRLTLATVLIAHGCHTLFGFFSGPGVGPGGLSASAAFFTTMGLSPGFAFAVLAGLVRLAGGMLIAIGWFTRPASAGIVTLVAIEAWRAQWRWGFFLNWMLEPTQGHGVEFSVLLIGALTGLVLTGAGDWSFDGRRAESAASRASARARLRTRG